MTDQEQQENDMLSAANEVERQKIADMMNVSLDQVHTFSLQEQEAGAITQEQFDDKIPLTAETKQEDEQPQKSDEEELAEFLASEQNRQYALQLAEQIQQVCGEKWFSIDKLIKKSAETKQTAFQKLKLCEMFGLLATRIGDWRDGRKELREQLYKVMISAKDRVEALDRIIQYHNDQIDKMTIERNLLAEAIPK